MASTTPSGPSAGTIVTIALGVLTTSAVGYAIYFDHKRRTDVGFRKSLKKESRKQARAAKVEAEQSGKRERESIRAMVDEANEEGFPEGAEDKEAYFMNEVARGEGLVQDPSQMKTAALCFYKALRVYPQQKELMNIYDKTVPKPVLDIIAEMVAYDRHISDDGSASSSAGVE